jgi:hypothetical protein
VVQHEQGVVLELRAEMLSTFPFPVLWAHCAALVVYVPVRLGSSALRLRLFVGEGGDSL